MLPPLKPLKSSIKTSKAKDHMDLSSLFFPSKQEEAPFNDDDFGLYSPGTQARISKLMGGGGGRNGAFESTQKLVEEN